MRFSGVGGRNTLPPEPLGKLRLLHIASGEPPGYSGGVLFRSVQLEVILKKEDTGRRKPDPLVSVHEGMVPDNAPGVSSR